MQCVVYKSLKKLGCYIYVKKDMEIADLPEALLVLLGELEQVMDLTLSPERELAQADPREVLANLESQGFYVQMPPADYRPGD